MNYLLLQTVFENSLMQHHIALPPDNMGKITYIAPPGQYSIKVCVLGLLCYCISSSISVGRSFLSPLFLLWFQFSFFRMIFVASLSPCFIFLWWWQDCQAYICVQHLLFSHSVACLYFLQFMILIFLLFSGYCIGTWVSRCQKEIHHASGF